MKTHPFINFTQFAKVKTRFTADISEKPLDVVHEDIAM